MIGWIDRWMGRPSEAELMRRCVNYLEHELVMYFEPRSDYQSGWNDAMKRVSSELGHLRQGLGRRR